MEMIVELDIDDKLKFGRGYSTNHGLVVCCSLLVRLLHIRISYSRGTEFGRIKIGDLLGQLE